MKTRGNLQIKKQISATGLMYVLHKMNDMKGAQAISLKIFI